MCVIIYKPANADLPAKKILKQCYDTNSDGAGFCYRHDNKVYLHKGFFNFKQLYHELQNVPQNSDIIIHCRIATSGLINADNCHPFATAQGYCLAHNGVIDRLRY